MTISNPDKFAAQYAENLKALAKDFGIPRMSGCFSSAEYFQEIGPPKTCAFSDKLLDSVQKLIDSVYFSFIVLPSAKTPKVEVGGYRGPTKEMNTFDFLRQVSGYFSYITAWNYLGIANRKKETIIIDGFNGKRTPAWDDLLKRTVPMICQHGDECNPYIATADIVAFLTDKKLWDGFHKLTPENIADVWEGYGFSVDTHFLDVDILSKIKWYTDEHIDLTKFYARPMVFLKADGYKVDDLKKLDVYPEATILARQLNGCVQGFDKESDSSKIKDGDIFIYAGEDAKKLATTLQDIYKIEILPFKDLKTKIETP
ncbi:hypothetical protein MUO69_01140 [Candidatus Bathyarchaeota archaeon]|nr:hypothetical protein [Candidatus Bathyarchaeota archaeon]